MEGEDYQNMFTLKLTEPWNGNGLVQTLQRRKELYNKVLYFNKQTKTKENHLFPINFKDLLNVRLNFTLEQFLNLLKRFNMGYLSRSNKHNNLLVHIYETLKHV